MVYNVRTTRIALPVAIPPARIPVAAAIRSRARATCAWQIATARASAASVGSGLSDNPRSEATICCICCLEAPPNPEMLALISRGE